MLRKILALALAGGIFLVVLLVFSSINSPEKKTLNTPDSSSFCPVRLDFFLPEELNETSGLSWYQDLLWTINDSGNEPLIYAVDTSTGSVRKRIRLLNTANIDWEDIHVFNGRMYVGDIGNNDGSRKDLSFYRFSLASINDSFYQEIVPEKIAFRYADQTDFLPHPYLTEWDAEAFFLLQDSIYLFTKDWKNKATSVYVLPDQPGEFTAVRKYSLQINGLITGATYNSNMKVLAVCGYSDFQPFVSFLPLVYLFSGQQGAIKKLTCDSLYGVQVEGITYNLSDDLYLSSELSVIPPSLFLYGKSSLGNRK
jgi:hypothetical protein